LHHALPVRLCEDARVSEVVAERVLIRKLVATFIIMHPAARVAEVIQRFVARAGAVCVAVREAARVALSRS
jgi:hypothetical protein